jgi:hypothetical protein
MGIIGGNIISGWGVRGERKGLGVGEQRGRVGCWKFVYNLSIIKVVNV